MLRCARGCSCKVERSQATTRYISSENARYHRGELLMKIRYHLWPAAAAAILVFSTLPALAVDPSGVWLTQDGDAHIKFASCGQAYCGTVVWLRDPLDPET